MRQDDDIRTGRHRVVAVHANVVVVPTYRHPLVTAAHLDRMEELMRAVCRAFGCELAECNGEADHVHLLVYVPPTVTLSRLVDSRKGVSPRRLRQEFPDLGRHSWQAKRLWAGS